MECVEEDAARTELALERFEREAFHLLKRLKIAVNDGATTQAAEEIWREAVDALRVHRGR